MHGMVGSRKYVSICAYVLYKHFQNVYRPLSLILDYCLSQRSGVLCAAWGIVEKCEAINILFYLHYYETNISNSYKISVILNL